MSDYYILDAKGEPIPERNLYNWAQWYETERKNVQRTEVGPYLVSTVFLGLDHNFNESGPPVLWETMVFQQKADGTIDYCELEMNRCSGSREQANAMHNDMVERVQALVPLANEH